MEVNIRTQRRSLAWGEAQRVAQSRVGVGIDGPGNTEQERSEENTVATGLEHGNEGRMLRARTASLTRRAKVAAELQLNKDKKRQTRASGRNT
jgi:hypothetical protein